MLFLKGFNYLNPNYKIFFCSSFISCIFTVYLVCNFVPETFYGILVSTTILIMSGIYLNKYAAYPSKWKIGEIILIIIVFITVFNLPSHFVASSRIVIKKKPKDDLLLKIDKFLLGWMIEDGQISLWIDQNNYIGPHTILGMFINNFLQINYFFYYLIPYVTMHFINLLNCLREIIFRYQNKGFRSITCRKNWNNTLFLFSVYILTCVFVFFINTLVPATSPRKYLKHKFKHPLILSGFGQFLNKKCKDEKSANSFPSGHVAEIVSIGFSYLATKEYTIGIIVLFNTILIALATLFLRYHYFCDILMALIVASLSFILNYYFGYKKYLENLKNNDIKFKNMKKVKITNTLSKSKKEVVIYKKLYNKITI